MLKFISILAVTVLALFAIAQLGPLPRALQAQTKPDNMRTYLEQLQTRMEGEPKFQVAIRFNAPLIPDEDTVWILPDRRDSSDNEIGRAIAEIGDDYICFDVIGGAARFIECTPFSNIISIRYFVQ